MGPRHYWAFAAPRYTGELVTKLRFKLTRDEAEPLYSNAFEGGVNPEQFGDRKEGHSATNVMDPYNE